MYFKSKGREHTEKTVELALNKAKETGIKTIVVASSKGKTLQAMLDNPASRNMNIICVTHAHGYPTPGESEMSEEVRAEFIRQGVKIHTASHVLSGAERGISTKFGGAYPVEIIAHTLRMFGQGLKVCVEVAVMALDAGLLPFQEEIIAIGGTGRGADTAIIIRPGHASSIFDTYISEIICKP
jgi:hypothetical protein